MEASVQLHTLAILTIGEKLGGPKTDADTVMKRRIPPLPATICPIP
jgi:hypothetical protein